MTNWRERFRRYRSTIGYVFLALCLAAILYLQDREADARRRFDDRRAYEVCVVQNEGREDINARFKAMDNFFKTISDPNDPKLKAFLASEKAAELKPRDCESLRPLND